MMQLNDKVAIVTGGSRGIGRAIALRLASEGARVFTGYQQDASAAESLVRDAAREGKGSIVAIQTDSARLEAIQRFSSTVAGETPHIDILVNNVGSASTGPEPLGTVDAGEYDRLFNLNTRGLFFTTQQFLPQMRDGGRIVNISSLSSRAVLPGRSVYAGTKAAIEAFTRVWAAELGSRNITVNSVSPGAVETDRFTKLITPELREKFARESPLGRVGTPEEIADVVLFLCGEGGRWMTAQNLIASGGLG